MTRAVGFARPAYLSCGRRRPLFGWIDAFETLAHNRHITARLKSGSCEFPRVVFPMNTTPPVEGAVTLSFRGGVFLSNFVERNDLNVCGSYHAPSFSRPVGHDVKVSNARHGIPTNVERPECRRRSTLHSCEHEPSTFIGVTLVVTEAPRGDLGTGRITYLSLRP